MHAPIGSVCSVSLKRSDYLPEPMAVLTVEQLGRRLGWTDIREEWVPQYAMRWFRIMPRDASLPSIDFPFDDKVEFLQQLGSGEWHCHPDSIESAIELARKLIHHEMCILEERDQKGKYGGSGPVGPGDIKGTLDLNADHFVRRFFGMPAIREPIDFSRYVRGKHLFVELQRKARSDAVWKSLGKPSPEF